MLCLKATLVLASSLLTFDCAKKQTEFSMISTLNRSRSLQQQGSQGHLHKRQATNDERRASALFSRLQQLQRPLSLRGTATSFHPLSTFSGINFCTCVFKSPSRRTIPAIEGVERGSVSRTKPPKRRKVTAVSVMHNRRVDREERRRERSAFLHL